MFGDTNRLEPPATAQATQPPPPIATRTRTARSLSTRAATCSVAVLTSVLTLVGCAVYLTVRTHLFRQFDMSLADRAMALSYLTEQEVEGIAFEWRSDEAGPGSMHPLECFQIWLADGASLAKSENLGDTELSHESSRELETPKYIAYAMPNGKPGRAITIRFYARREEVPSEEPSIAIDLMVARDLCELYAILASLRNLLLVVWIPAVALSSVTMIWAIRQSCQPLKDLSKQIENIDESHLEIQLDTDRLPSELVPIIVCVNSLMSRLAQAFAMEKQLTANIAHELRTPVSGIRMALEVTLSMPREKDEYLEMGHMCLVITLQIERLIETILSLSSLEAGVVAKISKRIDPLDLMHKCWLLCAEQARREKLEINWNVPALRAIVTYPELLERVFFNLFDNAVTYATANSTIHVQADCYGHRLNVSITNRVNEISKQVVQHAFEPFWRSDKARTSAKNNVGLGLSLCQKLIRNIGGSIELSIVEENTFRVDLEIIDQTIGYLPRMTTSNTNHD